MNRKKAYYKFLDKFAKTYPYGSFEQENAFVEAINQDWFLEMIQDCSEYMDKYRDLETPGIFHVYNATIRAFEMDLNSAYLKLKAKLEKGPTL